MLYERYKEAKKGGINLFQWWGLEEVIKIREDLVVKGEWVYVHAVGFFALLTEVNLKQPLA